jgi:ArsR family transcriptional regulator, arsenate/arsenite/antimonite-responsive transcriptional repressor / arsenate reductase (thioredoxin)
MDLSERARVHAALGDVHRLRVVDRLFLGDATFQELVETTGLRGNLAAHHLDVLEAAGLIERRTSDGDRRRRYISLRHDRLDGLAPVAAIPAGQVLFVCTHNSARSQFAAALWRARTGGVAESAGSEPAPRVHPRAVESAKGWGIDLSGAVPRGYDELGAAPELVVSVCDRARESGLPVDAPTLHWSIPDPVAAGDPSAFRSAFRAIAGRIDRLAAARSMSPQEARS